MKYCPNCQANVEGLLYRCDCCGATLDTTPHLFFAGLYELPQCLGFRNLSFQMIAEIEPKDSLQYAAFLGEIAMYIYCLPNSMLASGNVRPRVYYYSVRKKAILTLVVDFNDFVYADKDRKAHLVASAILQGLHMLRKRLNKSKHNIDELVVQAEEKLAIYLR